MSTNPRRIGRQHEDNETEKKRRIDREGIRTLARLFPYLRDGLGWLGISTLALMVSSGLGLILPLVVRSLVDGVLVEQNMSRLNQLGAGLMGVFAVQAIFSFAHQITLALVGERAIANIRKDIYAHLQTLSLNFYADNRTGELVSRITNDVTLLKEAITSNLTSLVRQMLTLIGAAGFLFYLNLRLTLLILIGIPIISLTMVFLGRRIRRAAKEVQDALAESANVVEETISGVRVVKSFAREPYEFGRFADRIEDTYEAGMRRARLSATLSPIIGFLAFASITITLWFGSFEVIQGRLTAGELVAYLVYTMMVAAPVATLASLYAQFQSALGAAERLFQLRDTPAEITNRPDATPLPPVVGRVTFEQVDFDYTSDVAVLKQVNFTAQPGQIIALVGPSGAGKSTLVNLIPRFYDVVDGAITVDGHDVRSVMVESLRQQIGIVPQETLLFSDTVLSNIRYGRLDATQEEIEEAAHAANAHDFIMQDLPFGYETMVGERGIKLSGGQRQRIAIARAILKDPRILILDEATSSLDSESEHLVQEALERLMAGRTSFVIAHRLSTVQNADWVLVLDQGRIVEQGTHTDLLANQSGLYRRLYDRQFDTISNGQ
ncbi:MAG: ABC transporter transmembrane domain-containing protein [Ardenticatenaceae bacterium]|nr:ABC transporter transmembrane domain-containing protein [Ardenticatenaceae bacterium]